jgi:hypothetical protein
MFVKRHEFILLLQFGLLMFVLNTPVTLLLSCNMTLFSGTYASLKSTRRNGMNNFISLES